MRIGRIVGMALENLKQRKLRTSLTTLGVVIGIMTIIALASLGEGLRLGVTQRMEAGFELNVLIVFPGSVIAGFGQPFTPLDVSNIRNVADVSLATPMITLPYAKIFRNHTEQLGAFTVGAVNFSEMQKMLPQRFQIADGDFPAIGDNDTVVLGYRAATRNGTALVSIGENVTFVMTDTQRNPIITKTLKVSGILQSGGTSGITNFDYWAFIPIASTVHMLGSEGYQIILVQVSDPTHAERVASDIEKPSQTLTLSAFLFHHRSWLKSIAF